MIKISLPLISTLLIIISWSALASSDSRWYDQTQLVAGKELFQQHCASCHGQNAEATPNWKETDANGFYPPPPLNGTAHAWHHDLPVLRQQIREGGLKIGGQMPAFKQVLNAQEIDNAIAFFQSQWPDDLYTKWEKNFNIRASLPSLDDIKKVLPTKRPDLTYLKQRLANTKIAEPKATGIDKLYAIPFNDKTLYLSEDGEFAIIGEMIDLKNGINLNKQTRD